MKKVSFHINKSFDKFIAEQFLNEKGGGIDFGKNIVKMHPPLKTARTNPKLRKDVINDYFDKYYADHKKEIIESIRTIKNGWGKVEQEYARVTEKIFGGYSFPNGMYAAYASIINCNPRFLDSKTFQFFYKKDRDKATYTIAHELLHFIFFDFVEKKMTNEIRKLSDDKLWDLSEIFNIVILRSAAYKKIINRKYVRPYPSHEKYIRAFEKSYKDSKNIEYFIRNGIRIMNK